VGEVPRAVVDHRDKRVCKGERLSLTKVGSERIILARVQRSVLRSNSLSQE